MTDTSPRPDPINSESRRAALEAASRLAAPSDSVEDVLRWAAEFYFWLSLPEPQFQRATRIARTAGKRPPPASAPAPAETAE